MVNVFSFCLYGPEIPFYYEGTLKNIELVKQYFPRWKVYVYVGSDVSEAFITKMETNSNVVIRRTGLLGAKNMIERFCAIDEPDVDIMIVRDADSRIHWRDRWCINEFLTSRYIAHTIRDHTDHTARIMGGLWGLRKEAGICIRKEYEDYDEDMSRGHRHAHDQNFLGDVIYPMIVDRMLVHYSNKRGRYGENAVQIPFVWTDDCYCGFRETRLVERYDPPMKHGAFSPLQFINGPTPKLINFLTTK